MDSDIINLKKEVFDKQKILAKIYREYGRLSLFSYVNSWKTSNAAADITSVAKHIQTLLLRTYPEKSVSGVLAQLNKGTLISSIDHHGIFNHPFFLNSNLIYSQRENQEYLLCLSTAGVSLNNSSWPGCLLVTDNDGRLRRFSFFPDKIKTQTVLAAKGLVLKDVQRVKLQIHAADFLDEKNKRQLMKFVEEIFENEEFLKFENFSKQAAYASSEIWATIFPTAPKLFYLPLEELVTSVITDEIAVDKEHVLCKLFFTVFGWDIIEKYFQGSLGAFGYGHKGSFLFWGIDGKGRRIHLERQKDKLTHNDFTILSDAENIASGLQTGKLYPTSLVCFLVLLYYGATCLGGFNQVNWLTDIKEKFVDLLKELGEDSLAGRVDKAATGNFAEGSLAFSINHEGQIYKPSALDLYLQNDPGLFEKYRLLSSKITLAESINVQLPEIYKVIVPAQNRDKKLLAITENDIINQNGIAAKIKSVLGA